jgi:hypothetical protein
MTTGSAPGESLQKVKCPKCPQVTTLGRGLDDMWDTTYRIGCEFIRAELIRRAEERGELGASAENLRCPHIDGAASDAMRKRRCSEKK